MNTLLQSKIEQAQQLHDMAMDAAEKALLSNKHNVDPNPEAYRQAFEYEREAANLLTDDIAFEPSRSVLHRSAAEQLICAALAGSPPEDTAEELRALLQQVYAVRIHAIAA